MLSKYLVFGLFLLSTCCLCISRPPMRDITYPIGFLFADEVDLSVKLAIETSRRLHNTNKERPFELDIRARAYDTRLYDDSYDLYTFVCDELRDGLMGLISAGSHDHQLMFDSVANRMHVPFINTQLPMRVIANPISNRQSPFSVLIRPSMHKLIADWIMFQGWSNIIFMLDGPDAMITVEMIYQQLAFDHPKHLQPIIQTELLSLPDGTSQFYHFLSDFHRARYNSTMKYHIVVQMANRHRQQSFLRALNAVTIQSPETFYYLFADLGTTASDLNEMRQSFLNITTFQLINTDSRKYKEFAAELRQTWRRSNGISINDEKKYLADVEISLDAALVHDSLIVLNTAIEQFEIHSLLRLSDQCFNGTRFVNDHLPGLFCHPTEDFDHPGRQFQPFTYGQGIAKHMQQTRIKSENTLSGPIQFDDFGVRQNFHAIVHDVTYQAGSSWSSEHTYRWTAKSGFRQERVQAPLVNISESKVVRIVTILTNPFAQLKRNQHTGHDELIGYCIDLTVMLTNLLGIKFEMHLVNDSRYGNVDEEGNWNGMIGELLHNQADMAVAPLTINRKRERVVDFSKPFINTGISMMIKKPDKNEVSAFSFMQPLSNKVWLFIILAFGATSSVGTYRKMWAKMNSFSPSPFVKSYEEGINRVREEKGRYVFLLEAMANEYESTQLPCDTMKVGDLLNSVGYGVATPFGSPYRQGISLAILQLQEQGDLKRLENKWWNDQTQCDSASAYEGQSVSLQVVIITLMLIKKLSKVAGIFYLLIGSMAISMVVTVCEMFHRRWKEGEDPPESVIMLCALAAGLGGPVNSIYKFPTPKSLSEDISLLESVYDQRSKRKSKTITSPIKISVIDADSKECHKNEKQKRTGSQNLRKREHVRGQTVDDDEDEHFEYVHFPYATQV